MKYLVVDARITSDGTVIYGNRPWITVSKDPMSVGGLYFIAGGRHSRVKLCCVIREITQPL